MCTYYLGMRSLIIRMIAHHSKQACCTKSENIAKNTAWSNRPWKHTEFTTKYRMIQQLKIPHDTLNHRVINQQTNRVKLAKIPRDTRQEAIWQITRHVNHVNSVLITVTSSWGDKIHDKLPAVLITWRMFLWRHRRVICHCATRWRHCHSLDV